MLDKSCWQWIDWRPCPDPPDVPLHGGKISLDGWCPECGKMRLRAKGYGYAHPDLDTPHFEPDFKGTVNLACPTCGYQGSFYVDVPGRKVLMVREVCSKEV